MKTKTTILCALGAVLLLTSSCKSHYQVTSIERTRILIDSRYDGQVEPQVA